MQHQCNQVSSCILSKIQSRWFHSRLEIEEIFDSFIFDLISDNNTLSLNLLMHYESYWIVSVLVSLKRLTVKDSQALLCFVDQVYLYIIVDPCLWCPWPLVPSINFSLWKFRTVLSFKNTFEGFSKLNPVFNRKIIKSSNKLKSVTCS